MIRTSRGEIYNCYLGNKICGKYINKDIIIYASPYDSKTTKYFYDNYKNYISDIFEYGKRNEYEIEFINNDPDLICSLIDVGKTRWLVGDGKAYIDTGCNVNNNSSIKCRYILNSSGTKIMYGVSDGTPSATNAYGMLKIYNSPNRYGFGYTNGSTIDSTNGSVIGVDYELYQNKNKLYINNENIMNMPSTSWKTDRTLWLYARNCPGSIFQSDDKKSYFAIYDDDNIIRNFVPYKNKDTNECGMLDTVELKFYGNANSQGKFTIELT